jgi:hypothetical protein
VSTEHLTPDQKRAHLLLLAAFANTFEEHDEFNDAVLNNLKRRCAYGNDQLPTDKTGRVDAIQMAYLNGARDLISYIERTVEEARALDDEME